MRLATGLLALWRRDGESQLGSDPRVAVVLEGLSSAQQRALDVLSRRAVASSVELAHEAHAGVREVRDLVRRLAARGVAVVLVSSEVPEVLGLADRVLVIREGRVVREAPATELDEGRVLDLVMEGRSDAREETRT